MYEMPCPLSLRAEPLVTSRESNDGVTNAVESLFQPREYGREMDKTAKAPRNTISYKVKVDPSQSQTTALAR